MIETVLPTEPIAEQINLFCLAFLLEKLNKTKDQYYVQEC
jgi:hypothetical protein